MGRTDLPESFERDDPAHGSSDRSFGLVFTGLFLIIGLAPLLHDRPVQIWSLALAAALLGVALGRASLLAPLNRLWTQFGLLLHRVVNPIVMAAIYFLAITPFGIAMRLVGKDPLRRGFDRQATSYWIDRKPPGPSPQSMTNQF